MYILKTSFAIIILFYKNEFRIFVYLDYISLFIIYVYYCVFFLFRNHENVLLNYRYLLVIKYENAS